MKRHFFVAFLLSIIAFILAIQLIIVRYETRQLFTELQQLQQQRDQLNVEWEKLQLERRTWAHPDRIEAIAKEKLHMFIPTSPKIIKIHP